MASEDSVDNVNRSNPEWGGVLRRRRQPFLLIVRTGRIVTATTR